jgi:hypothetical protein
VVVDGRATDISGLQGRIAQVWQAGRPVAGPGRPLPDPTEQEPSYAR